MDAEAQIEEVQRLAAEAEEEILSAMTEVRKLFKAGRLSYAEASTVRRTLVKAQEKIDAIMWDTCISVRTEQQVVVSNEAS